MKSGISLLITLAAMNLFSSCSLITAPVKIAGDIVEGTYNTGKAVISPITN